MTFQVYSTNPAVKAIISGTAPRPAILAAARGILPLGQNDLLEVLVALAQTDDAELAQSASATLAEQNKSELEYTFKSGDVAPQVLDFFAERDDLPKQALEAVLTNPNTPPQAIARFARRTQNGELLEFIALNQQLLIQTPEIIESIIANPHRTPEAERRAAETKREFFEKERGAEQIAGELRAQGKEAAAEFVEAAETNFSLEDAILLAELIEVPDAETDDSWLSLEYLEEFYEESDAQREAIIGKILGELNGENDEISGERISMINRIMRMKMKDRVRLAMKGDREARNILIRDPNRIVSQAVVENARITEQEIEKIASMRTVPEEVLRLVANNRNWARNYTIVHNLARNPRTPIANVMTILTRLQLRDLEGISGNRNISDAVRRQAMRLVALRKTR